MKIQCDVCFKKEASIFCTADEAALCDVCDQRVHHANKLASKHERFSLIHPSYAPICDICQEKRAVLFCQQDRAIMCRDCDLPLHSANEHTQKHNRFLLTGVKLDKMCINDAKTDHVNGSDQVPNAKSSSKKPTSFSTEISSTSATLTHSDGDCSKRTCSVDNDDKLVSGGSTSSISEYLTELLPGWHFEDFIVDSSDHSPFGFCKNDANGNDFGASEEDLSLLDVDLFYQKQTRSCSFTIQDDSLGMWVPQAPPKIATSILYGEPVNIENIGGLLVQGTNVRATKGSRKRNNQGLDVPQITTNKRIRPFC